MQPIHFRSFLKTRNWESSTRYHCWNAAKSFLRWRYGEKHPALILRIKRDDPGPQRTLTADEVRKLVSSIDTTTRAGKRDLPLVLLMLDSGLRASEICSLELKNLDLDNKRLNVRGKGGKWREAVFSDLTRAFL